MKFLNKTLTKNINIPFIAIPVIVLSSLALIASDNITKANAAAGRPPSPNKPIPPAVKPKTFSKQPPTIPSGNNSEQPSASGVQAKIKSLQEQASEKPKQTKPAPTRKIRDIIREINEDSPENKNDNPTTSGPIKANESFYDFDASSDNEKKEAPAVKPKPFKPQNNESFYDFDASSDNEKKEAPAVKPKPFKPQNSDTETNSTSKDTTQSPRRYGPAVKPKPQVTPQSKQTKFGLFGQTHDDKPVKRTDPDFGKIKTGVKSKAKGFEDNTDNSKTTSPIKRSQSLDDLNASDSPSQPTPSKLKPELLNNLSKVFGSSENDTDSSNSNATNSATHTKKTAKTRHLEEDNRSNSPIYDYPSDSEGKQSHQEKTSYYGSSDEENPPPLPERTPESRYLDEPQQPLSTKVDFSKLTENMDGLAKMLNKSLADYAANAHENTSPPHSPKRITKDKISNPIPLNTNESDSKASSTKSGSSTPNTETKETPTTSLAEQLKQKLGKRQKK